ncbi:hypothetical protein PsorP6_006632 [Peronosclerospora sorghi]|uniref:Uncharacterized protein n=1 Tax=Peronosclerospora sorghi TaxID=230839 RepID=A0ACC0W711_9STRA|nr:hypothetical protein PsorP6_006632 [Peronosclerospora sorghi]
MMLVYGLRRPSLQRQVLLQSSCNDFAHLTRFFRSTYSIRFFQNTNIRSIDLPPTKQDETEESSNTKIWNSILANHPEQHEKQGGDLLYEYPQKVQSFPCYRARKMHQKYTLKNCFFVELFWVHVGWIARSYCVLVLAERIYTKSGGEYVMEKKVFFFLSTSLFFLLSIVHPVLGQPTLFSFMTDELGSSLGFGTSILLAGLIGFRASRTVARISIVAGGKKLRFTTHKFFGDLSTPRDVPIAYVSAHPDTTKHIILKLAHTRGFYLVDTRGTFFNRDKLERLITFRTNFQEHKSMMENKTMAHVRTDLPRVDLKAEQAQTETNVARRGPRKKQKYWRKKSKKQ